MRKIAIVWFFFWVPLSAPLASGAMMDEAREARGQCEDSWLKSRRVQATERLSEIGTRMALQLNPLSATSRADAQDLETITRWLDECIKLNYSE